MRDLDLHGAAVAKKAGDAEALAPAELEVLYAWIDGVPLSRPKKNFARDFSDGVLVAEVVKHFVPHIVEMHNYVPAQSVAQKQSNWETIQAKLLKKLKMRITPAQILAVASSKPLHIEPVLQELQDKIETYLANSGAGGGGGGGGGGDGGERSRAQRDNKRVEREEARAARDAARMAKAAERKARGPIDPWSKMGGGISQDIAKVSPGGGGGGAGGGFDPAPAPAPHPPAQAQPRRRARRSEPQLGGEPPAGASPGELNAWRKQQERLAGGGGGGPPQQGAVPRQQKPAAARQQRQPGGAAAAAPSARGRASHGAGSPRPGGAPAVSPRRGGAPAADPGGGASSGFDERLLVEKDRVITEVRTTFLKCNSKIAAIEQMVGLAAGGAGGYGGGYAPGPGSAPAAYAQTQYNAGW